MILLKKFVGGLLISSSALFAVSGFASEGGLSTGKLQQSALIFSQSDMQELMSSSAIRVSGFPLTYSSQIRLACMSVPAWKDELLAFLPETSTCVPFSALSNSSQYNFNIQTGRDGQTIGRKRILQELQQNHFLVIRISAPAESFSVLQVDEVVAGVCSCPGNLAPTVNLVSGGSQNVTISSAIDNIVFSATDADSQVLMDTFTYDLNNGATIDNLPTGLSKSCTSDIGTLSCTLSGTAPDVQGTYHIHLSVSDGFNSTSQSVSLTVSEPVQEIIFKNGFENAP